MMYYFANGQEQRGPYSLEEMAQFGLRADTLVWREGMDNWQRMDTVPELMALAPGAAVAPATTTEPSETIAEPAPSAPPAAPIGNWAPPQPGYALPTGEQYAIQYQSALGTPPASGMAIASLVLGIVALLSFCMFHIGVIIGLPCAILALVFGILVRPKVNSGQMGGKGMALAGIICGSIYLALLVIAVIGILVFVALSMK
jgi:hypothetical protein